jgi:uncharacterized protein (TIGR02246 family)
MKWQLPVSAFVLLALAACTPPAPAVDLAAEAETIRGIETATAAAIAADDAATAASAYAPDAIVFIPFEAPQADAAAIQASFQELIDDPAGALTYSADSIEVASAGDVAYSTGTFSVTYTDETTHAPATVTGNYVTVWEKQDDGTWKIVRDVNTPGPMPTAAPATPAPTPTP